MKSIYAKYFKEMENAETIEYPYGFITYLFNGDECLIMHLYVEPEYRGKHQAFYLANDVSKHAIKNKCKYLSAAVYINHKSVTYNVKTFLKYGFEIRKCSDTHIIMIKNLSGG